MKTHQNSSSIVNNLKIKQHQNPFFQTNQNNGQVQNPFIEQKSKISNSLVTPNQNRHRAITNDKNVSSQQQFEKINTPNNKTYNLQQSLSQLNIENYNDENYNQNNLPLQQISTNQVNIRKDQLDNEIKIKGQQCQNRTITKKMEEKINLLLQENCRLQQQLNEQQSIFTLRPSKDENNNILQLEQKIKTLDNLVCEQENELDYWRKKASKFQENQENGEQKCLQLIKQNQELNQIIIQNQNTLNQHIQTITDYEEKLTVMIDEINKLQEIIAIQRQSDSAEEMFGIQSQNQELQIKINELLTQNYKLNQMLTQTQPLMKQKESEIEDWNEKFYELKNQYNNEKMENSKKDQLTSDCFQKELLDCQEKYKQKSKQIDLIKQQFEELRLNYTPQPNNEAETRQIYNLKQEIETLQNESKNLRESQLLNDQEIINLYNSIYQKEEQNLILDRENQKLQLNATLLKQQLETKGKENEKIYLLLKQRKEQTENNQLKNEKNILQIKNLEIQIQKLLKENRLLRDEFQEGKNYEDKLNELSEVRRKYEELHNLIQLEQKDIDYV